MSNNVDPAKSLRSSLSGHWKLGGVIVAVCFIGTGIWASFSELSSAAIASGNVSPDGSQRVIQHLEGGIVRGLNVKEGDLVRQGDVLIVLDKALAKANYLSTFRKLQRFLVTRDRLMAQERGADSFIVQSSPTMENDTSFQQFVSNEVVKFDIRKKLMENQRSTYSVQQKQVEAEISSLEAQIAGMDEQIHFLEKELVNKRKLVKKGLARQPELFALERKRAELWSERNAIASTIARARQKIEEIRIAELTMVSEEMQAVARELSEINSEIALAEESLTATNDILSRTDIPSPIEGRVLKVHYKTIGAVVRPGEPIVTIVPDKEELILDTRLQPTDIDNVEIGMAARVQLTSFMARHLKPLHGEIFHIGADAETDDQTGERYYNVRVRVEPEAISSIGEGVELVPGMPAEVFIQTGTHTPLRYLFDPILKSFNRAFREESA
ncbi:HlyD family type I secretion periplasmic adaptor subunit [Roseibium sp. SCP14]|uniref:HlyD family type I secretion periplasmic adaptor subunit n=1 Tax=Roseibium sp. SCP14 TaxID=3141375 RepID=UPI0033361AB7